MQRHTRSQSNITRFQHRQNIDSLGALALIGSPSTSPTSTGNPPALALTGNLPGSYNQNMAENQPTNGSEQSAIEILSRQIEQLRARIEQAESPPPSMPPQFSYFQQPNISLQLNYVLKGQENYQSWSTDVKSIARAIGIHDELISRTAARAAPQKATLAHSLILLNLNAQIKPTVSSYNNPAEIWNYLKASYETYEFIQYMHAWNILRNIKFTRTSIRTELSLIKFRLYWPSARLIYRKQPILRCLYCRSSNRISRLLINWKK